MEDDVKHKTGSIRHSEAVPWDPPSVIQNMIFTSAKKRLSL
jgi:hypothetical protein